MGIKKIVVIGPESTGKSTLCAQLAAHYQTLWVPEYAREYLEENGTDYSYNDLLTIAKGQVKLEEEISSQLSAVSNQKSAISNQQPAPNIVHHTSHIPYLFIDTDMYVMKVWCEFVFNQCHNWILNQIASRNYDAYLL
jgi:nicotinamide riboside kinase